MNKPIVVRSAHKRPALNHLTIESGWSAVPLCGKLKRGSREFPDALANCTACIAEARARHLDVDHLVQLPPRVRSLVRAVRKHAEDHYEQGWDVIVETQSDHDLARIIGKALTPKSAIARVAAVVEVQADRRAGHNAEAQAATDEPDTLHYHLPEDLHSEGHRGCACGAVFPTNRALDLHVAEARIAAGDYNPFEQGHHPDGSHVSWHYDEHGGDHWATRSWPGKVGHGTMQIVPTEDGYQTVESYSPGWKGEHGLTSPNWCDGPVPF